MNDEAINCGQVSPSQLREALQIASRIARLASKNGDTEFVEKLLNILVAKEIERFTEASPPQVNGEIPGMLEQQVP